MATSPIEPQVQQELALALERERDRLRRTLRSLAEAERALGTSQGDESDAGGVSADVASDLAEQELDVTLELAERQRLAEVEAALERLAEGRYGICQRCGGPVDVERLRALPWASYCLACAQRAARAGGPRGA